MINNKRFDLIERRLDSLETRMDRRFEQLEFRIGRIEIDLKEFYKVLAEHATEIARLKDRTDLK